MYSTQLAPTRTSVIADRDTDGRRSRTTSAAAAEIFRNNRCKRRKPKTVELAAAREPRRRPVYDCFVRPYGDPSGGITDTPMPIRLHCTAGAKHVRYIQNLSLTRSAVQDLLHNRIITGYLNFAVQYTPVPLRVRRRLCRPTAQRKYEQGNRKHQTPPPVPCCTPVSQLRYTRFRRERKCADTTGTVPVQWAGHFQC